MNIIKRLIHTYQNDPVKKCEKYKKQGCAFVDSMHCDMTNCNILEDFKNKK